MKPLISEFDESLHSGCYFAAAGGEKLYFGLFWGEGWWKFHGDIFGLSRAGFCRNL